MIPRSVFLGDTVTSTMLFQDNGEIVVSKDNTRYPIVVVKDPEHNLLFIGVGTFSSIDNLYHTEFEIPDSALLSDTDAKYIIEWEIVSPLNKVYKATEYFDVVHPSYNLTQSKEQQKIALPFTPLNLSIPLPGIPSTITMSVYDQFNNVVYTSTPVNKGVYSEYYIYTTTVPANTFTTGDYAILWQFTLGTEDSSFFQKVMCIDTWALGRISDLRMRVDKYLKDIDTYTGYRDSDLYFHLTKGLDYLNMYFIPTDWTMVKFKGELAMMLPGLITCALYSLLRAQYLAEGDASFSYSGQPVSLEIDRSQFIEAEIGRLENEINDVVKPAKEQFIKRGSSVGVLGLTYPSVNGTIGGVRKQDLWNAGISARFPS